MATSKQPPEKSVEEIVALLQEGNQGAWTYVNRSNISALIIEADTRGDKKLTQALRDWL